MTNTITNEVESPEETLFSATGVLNRVLMYQKSIKEVEKSSTSDEGQFTEAFETKIRDMICSYRRRHFIYFC